MTGSPDETPARVQQMRARVRRGARQSPGSRARGNVRVRGAAGAAAGRRRPAGGAHATRLRASPAAGGRRRARRGSPSTSGTRPRPPWRARSRPRRPPTGREWVACDGTLAASPDGRYVSFEYQDSVTILDRHEQHMIGCRRSGSRLSRGDCSKPFVAAPVHLVPRPRRAGPARGADRARRRRASCCPGESGTGKSTTSLASVSQGLELPGRRLRRPRAGRATGGSSGTASSTRRASHGRT